MWPRIRFSDEIMSNSNATCYYTGGDVAGDNYFCGFPNRDSCCGFGWECLSNGLCRKTGTTDYAPSCCTDPSYKKCLSFCNDAQPDKFTTVSRCEPAGNSWCFACNLQNFDGPSCCDTNLTTSLEPYPFTVGTPIQSTVDSSSSTTSIPSVTELTSTPSSSSYLDASLELTREAFFKTLTETSTTPSRALTSSPSTQPTNQSHDSKMEINVGITVAAIAILLAILAFFIFQNRKFKQRLLQLRERPSRQEETRTEVRKDNENPSGELDLTLHELAQQNTPRHELFGNEIHELSENQIHELYHRSIPEHDLTTDDSQR